MEDHLHRPATEHAFNLQIRQGRKAATQGPFIGFDRCRFAEGPKKQEAECFWPILALQELSLSGLNAAGCTRMGRVDQTRSED